MKHKNRMFAFVLALVMTAALAGCARSQKDSLNDPNLPSFPGTHWNDTPEQVIASLGLTEEQILFHASDNIGIAGTEQWTVVAENVDCFGASLSYVCFRFIRYDGYPRYGLETVTAFYPEGTDMAAVQDQMVRAYGCGVEKVFESIGETAADGHRMDWQVSLAKGLTQQEQEAFLAYLTSEALPNPYTPEGAQAYLYDYNLSTAVWQDDVKPFEENQTSNRLLFSGMQAVYIAQVVCPQ